MLIGDAIKKAEEYGLDLAEVAPTAQPPVCKILDYGKYKYEQSKKLHTGKSQHKSAQLKEIKLRPHTDQHDLDFKIKNIKRFLDEGIKTKITLTFRGREMEHLEIGKSLLARVAEEIKEAGTIEHAPRLEGRNMIMVISPKS